MAIARFPVLPWVVNYCEDFMTNSAFLRDGVDTNDAKSAAIAQLAQISDEKAIAAWVIRERQILIEQWTPVRGGRTWMHAYSSLLDAVIRRLLAISAERTARRFDDRTAPAHVNGVAILAVGGYGQRLCAPHSDVDVTFLSVRDEDPVILHQMFSLVMDVLLTGAKIRVGYAYRSLAEMRGDTLDHQTQTALLDGRLVAGDATLFREFQTTFAEHLHVADFLFQKEAERARIRDKWGNSPYIIEPNVKEGVGGLRDIQSAAWMARVRFGKSGEALWRDLVRRKVVTPDDLTAFNESRELLLSVRCALHLLSGDRRDLLTPVRQESVANLLAQPPFPPDESNTNLPPVERFMERYYHAASNVERISNKVMTRCLDAPLALGVGTGLSSVRRAVAITDPERAEANPLWPMMALAYCQEHRLELALPTEESIERFVTAGGVRAAESPDGANALGIALLELLVRPGDGCATVRRMLRTQLMGALLPEFERCMGLIPYDSSHSHTVGEHSLRVLGNLIFLRDHVAENDPSLAGYFAILESLATPLPLFLGALLHDIGKQWTHLLSGERAGHEDIGAERIPMICKRLGCPEKVTEHVCFLTRNHLLLSRISRLRDLSQPSTIREAIRAVGGDRERLRMLYLLTWADTRSVGPGVSTEMSEHLLEELFSRADHTLEAAWHSTETPVDAEVNDNRLAAVRQRLQRQLTIETRAGFPNSAHFTPIAADVEEIEQHIQFMPAAYLLNTPPETIAVHVAMIERIQQSGGVTIYFRAQAPGAPQTDLTVVAQDSPGLFAKLTGALFASDIRLHRAQAFVRPLSAGDSAQIVIDTLTVDHRERPLGVERRRAAEEAIRALIDGDLTLTELLVERHRTTDVMTGPLVIRALQIDDTTSADFTLVEIETAEETAIAYRLSARFAEFEWNIYSARISMWGGNARCAFYLTDTCGRKLPVSVVHERLQPFVSAAQIRR